MPPLIMRLNQILSRVGERQTASPHQTDRQSLESAHVQRCCCCCSAAAAINLPYISLLLGYTTSRVTFRASSSYRRLDPARESTTRRPGVQPRFRSVNNRPAIAAVLFKFGSVPLQFGKTTKRKLVLRSCRPAERLHRTHYLTV